LAPSSSSSSRIKVVECHDQSEPDEKKVEDA
jgi:hypothetical protein